MDLVSPRNIEEVVAVLKREVLRTQEGEQEKATVYRSMLIQAIHTCAARFPEVADAVVHVLMDFLSGDGALDVIVFVRSIIEQYPAFRPSILNKLLQSFAYIQGNTVLGVAVWILGEYAMEPTLRKEAFDCLLANAGQPPYLPKSTPAMKEGVGEGGREGGNAPGQQLVSKSVVLADGTYATQVAMVPVPGGAGSGKLGAEDKSSPAFRRALLEGDVFLGGLLVSSLTKLTVQALETAGPLDPECKEMQAKTLLVACGVGRMAEVKAQGNVGAYADVLERITVCARVLLDPDSLSLVKDTLLTKCKMSYAAFLKFKQEEAAKSDKARQGEKEGGLSALPDALINFRQLRHFGVQTGDFDLYDGEDIQRATGAGAVKDEVGDWSKRLAHVYQLSGLADPVYAEAYVTVHDYDIVLEILVINRTKATLTNLTVELATMGDLKLIERPQSHTIGPQDQRIIRANIKVSSTETGHIFGTIVYENSSTAEKGTVNLNDIQVRSKLAVGCACFPPRKEFIRRPSGEKMSIS